MKVKHLIAALELGKPDDEVIIQNNFEDGYFNLKAVGATQPDGHIGADGFVIHAGNFDALAEDSSFERSEKQEKDDA